MRGWTSVIAVCSFAMLAGCKHDAATEPAPPAVEVHCVAPETVAVDETVALRGRVEPPPGGDLPVASQVSGRIVSISVHEGQRIAKGDIVAVVDEVASQSAVRQAEASLAQALAAEQNANTTLDRTRALVQRGIAAKQELEDAQARADAAKATVAAANASLDLARRTLGRVVVRSSFQGVVTRVWRGVGALVDGTAATPIAQVAATGALEFVGDATERELGAIAEGQAAKGTFLAGGAEFAGTVRARSSALDPATGLGSVRITLEAKDTQVPMGSFGRVVVTTGRREGVLVLPSAALRGAVADGAEIVLCKDGRAEVKTVKVGWRDDKQFEVVEGAGAADTVAVDHVLGLETDTAIAEPKPGKDEK